MRNIDPLSRLMAEITREHALEVGARPGSENATVAELLLSVADNLEAQAAAANIAERAANMIAAAGRRAA